MSWNKKEGSLKDVDQAGAKLWDDNFGDDGIVSINNMAEVLREYFPDPPECLELVVRYLIDSTRIGFVMFGFFGDFLRLYGPFETCLERAQRSVFSNKNGSIFPWFHGHLSKYESEETMDNADVGSFLVRHGLTERDSFTICHRILENGIPTVKKISAYNLGVGYCLSKTPTIEFPVFDTLPEVVTSFSDRLVTPIVSRLYQRDKQFREYKTMDLGVKEATHVVQISVDGQIADRGEVGECMATCASIDCSKCERIGRSIYFDAQGGPARCTGSQGAHVPDIELLDTQIIVKCREKSWFRKSRMTNFQAVSTIRLIYKPFIDKKYEKRRSTVPVGGYPWARFRISGRCTVCGIRRSDTLQSNQCPNGFTFNCKCSKGFLAAGDHPPHVTCTTIKEARDTIFDILAEALSESNTLDMHPNLLTLVVTFLY